MAQAAGGGGGGGGGGDEAQRRAPSYERGVQAIKAAHYKEAIDLLNGYVLQARDDADGYNWLAYAYRKTGQLEPAFTHYKRALAIDPQHLGAHEYIGEAYLMAGQPAQAEQHLRKLESLCPSGCEQREDLGRAIAAYHSRKPATTAAGPGAEPSLRP
jgi:tetratricopeptide (TPR) repeat protein